MIVSQMKVSFGSYVFHLSPVHVEVSSHEDGHIPVQLVDILDQELLHGKLRG